MVAYPAHNFLPHTRASQQAMLATCGFNSIGDLFADVPASLHNPSFTYAALRQHGLDELTLEQTLLPYASQNTGVHMACFLGGGAYHRYVPAVVNHIASRSEFYTAYTPYQPEIAQGTLQVIYGV
jgi:glycine dehydrogenase subunit 1